MLFWCILSRDILKAFLGALQTFFPKGIISGFLVGFRDKKKAGKIPALLKLNFYGSFPTTL